MHSEFAINGWTVTWMDIAIWAIIVILAVLASCAIWFLIRSISSKKISQLPFDYQILRRQLDAKVADRKRKEADKLSLQQIVDSVEKSVLELKKSAESLLRRNNNADIDIGSSQKVYEQLQERLQRAENDRIQLEKEVQDLQLSAKAPLKAKISTRPGEKFFVYCEIEGQTSPIVYPDVRQSARAFSTSSGLADFPRIVDDKVEWAFDSNRCGSAIVMDNVAAEKLRGKLFFIGDVHGDADVLGRALEFIFRSDANAVVVFLGDLFDRGAKSMHAARMLVWAAKKFPGQVLWLCGNHDMGLRYDEASGKFASDVEPSEFKDYLNSTPEEKEEGMTLIDIIKTLPIACVIGNLWASHGGVPHNDVSGSFTGFDSMSKEMKDDCVWSRMKDVPAKLPNRSHRGAEVGFKDAVQFFDVLKKSTGIVIRHIVCAHQHEHTGSIGCLQFRKYYKPETLSCQCIFTFEDKDYDAEPCVLVYNGPEEPPAPHTI